MKGLTAFELIGALKADLSAVEVEIHDLEKTTGQPKQLNSEEFLQQLRDLDDLYTQQSLIRDSLRLVEAKYKELNQR